MKEKSNLSIRSTVAELDQELLSGFGLRKICGYDSASVRESGEIVVG